MQGDLIEGTLKVYCYNFYTENLEAEGLKNFANNAVKSKRWRRHLRFAILPCRNTDPAIAQPSTLSTGCKMIAMTSSHKLIAVKEGSRQGII